MRKLLTFLTLLVLAYSVGWADTLFHETFGNNSAKARAWDDTYSVKSGVSAVYTGITSYTVSNVKQGKNTTGYIESGLNQSTQNQDASIIIGPLNVANYSSLGVTYYWKAASINGTYSTALYYATSADGTYTEVSGTGTGATTFVQRSYTLPAAAQVSTLYLKIVWNTSNTQAIIDEVELTGTASGGGDEPTSYDLTDASSNGTVTFSVSGTTVTKAAENDVVTATATPATHYHFTSMSVTDGTVSNFAAVSGQTCVYTFTMPAEPVEVTAVFTEDTKYDISFGSHANGSLSVDATGDKQYAGETVTVTATPSSGYALDAITVTGDNSGDPVTVTNGAFTMPAEPVTVSATFSKSTSTTATFVAGTDVGTSTAQNNTDQIVKNLVTIYSSNAALATAQYRLYKNSNTTISVPEGSLITRIVFEGAGSDNQVTGFSALTGLTIDSSANIATWTGNAQSVTVVAGGAQVRLSKITVTYTTPSTENAITRVIKTNGTVGNSGGWLGDWSGCSEVATPGGDGVSYTVKAESGETVQFKAGTNEGYQILDANVTAEDGNGNPVTLTKGSSDNTGTTFSFKMPATTVTITANFTTYLPTIRLAGRFNGRTSETWITDSSGPVIPYDSTNEQYSIDAYFIGAVTDEGDNIDFIYFRSDKADLKAVADGNCWVAENGGTYNLGGSSNFRVLPGVYTITINKARTQVTFTKKSYSLAFSPADGSSVETGSTASVSCSALESVIAGIKAADSGAAGDVTVGVNDDNGSTWSPSYTFVTGDAGSKTIYGKAYIGNIAVTGSATYTVTPADNSNKYQLATTLTSSKKYLIVGYQQSDDVWFVAGAYDSSNNRLSGVTVTPNGDGSITATTAMRPATLGGSSDAWTLRTSDGYVYNNIIDNTNGKAQYDSSTAHPATITFEDETSVAKIIFNENSVKGWLRANRWGSSGSYTYGFGGYANSATTWSGAKIYLYEQVATGAYTITYAPVEGGSLSGPADANAGDLITVTATASAGYACTGITVNPSAPVTDNHDGTYTFTMPAANVTVTPTWAEAIAITYVNKYLDNNGENPTTGDAGGTVTGPSSAVADNEVRLTVTPESAYQLQSLEYAWATGHAEVPGTQAGSPFFLMPGTPTTVTATFEKKPFNITVVSPNGQVTGVPATAVSGQTVSFTVTPVAGYTITNVFCTWVDGEQEGSVTVDSSNAPTYSFVMPAKDVTVRVGYFAGDEYELLTDEKDIVEGETYLIVGGAASGDYTHTHVMGTTLSNKRLNAVELTSATYNNGIISSSSSMNLVDFVEGTGDNAGKWAIHTADGYLYSTSTGNIQCGSTPYYSSISVDAGDHNRATIQLVDGNYQLSFHSGSPMFRFYSGSQGATYIYKLANSNKVKKPTITGAAGQYIGLYNFIGTDQVTLACATAGASIEYKIGSGEWTAYSKPFALPQTALGSTVTVSARATKTGMDASGEVSAVFTCVKPEWHTKPCGDNWSCADQQYDSPVFIYPNGSLANRNAYGKANIRFFYTLDGTTPTMASDEVPTPSSGDKFIFLDEDVTLKIIPVINDIVGDPVSGIITFVPAAPTATLAAGLYDGDQQTRLSTTTKEKISNTTWTTQIWYTLDSSAPAFAFSNDGTVTSTGWTRYDPTTAPYIDIKVENGNVQTLRSVTLTNFISGEFTGQYSGASVNLNSTGTWTASATTSTTYTLTAANLDVVFSPAGGTYLYSKDVTLTPQNTIGAVTMKYDITWANPDATHVSATGVTYDGAITVDRDATITVHASDSRTGDGGTYEKSHTYKIGVQEPLYSPYPGDYQDENTGDYLYGNFYVVPSSGTSTINVEIFDVTPNAKIYYTVTETTTDDTEYDGSKPYPLPDTPTNANGTLYTGPITLTAGNTYVFSAVAYVGNMVSPVRTRTFTVRENTASGNYWYSIKEMNEETDHSTTKTLANPVEIIYMSTYQNNGTTPEFAFVRDNSGYGYIYFGKNATGKDTWKKYNPGEWIKGMTIRGKASTWGASYINELDLQSESDNTAWNAGLLDPRALVPEYTTCRAIREGWTGGEDFTGSDYEPYVDKSKHMFGHYVHLRRNTLSGVSKDNNGKYQGTIVGELGTKLFYYDGLYLYSGFNGSKNYDQTFFNSIQEKGGTFEVYGIAYFYGPNAAKASSYYQPYEIFPIDFDWIFPPIFHLEGDASASDMTNDTPERTIHAPSTVTLSCDTRGAVIMYKTSDMEDYEVYNGQDIAVNKTMTISTYSIHSTEHFDQMESKVRTLTINMGDVKQPVISPESCVKAIGDEAVTVSITCETSEATIWYTLDGSDPADENNTARSEYTAGTTLTFSTTTTVRAIASAQDGSETFYGMEAESKTYTFVKSNGIVYDLVKSAADLSTEYVYVIVNKQYNAAVMNVQDTNNRKSAGVKFLDSTDDGYTGEKEQVFGNDDLAVFTLNNENGNWVFHTANGVNNASIGYMYGAVSGSTNQWKSEFTKDSEGKTLTTITIDGANSDVDKAYAAHILYTGGSGDRYLRFNKSYDLFNTYSSEMTGQEVFLYRKLAWPLAKIEKVGVKDREYTISDELIGVYANGTKLWAKDQGNVSISKRENTEGWEDYVAALYPNAHNKAEWDQSNWVCLELGEGKEQLAHDLVGQFIDPTSVTGTLTDKVNYTITVSSTPTSHNGDAGFQATDKVSTTSVNVMTAPNFNDAYTGENGAQTTAAAGRTFFFVRPKVQEVVTVTNVTWDGSKFVIPAKNGPHNTADFNGAINVNWDLYEGTNKSTIESQMESLVAEQPDMEFTFLAVVSAPTSGDSGAPRRAPKAGDATTTLVLQPTSITLPATPTGVDDVKVANREVKAVKYVDVVGRVSDRPFEGLNIIVTEYTDGSVETVKVLK